MRFIQLCRFRARFYFLTLISGLTWFSWSAQGTPPLERPPLTLGQGEQRLLNQPGLLRYSLGAPLVRAHTLPSRETILIKGVQPGYTDLWVWKKDGSSEHRTIHVLKPTAEPSFSPSLERALGRLEEVEIIFTGSAGVVIRGNIESLAESARIAALRQGHPKDVQDETMLSGKLLSLGLSKVSEWIQTSGLSPALRVEPVAQNLWLRGAVTNPQEKNAIEQQALALFPKIKLALESLPDSSPTVHFKVYLLEVHRNRFGSLGLTWPPNQAGAFQVTPMGIQNSLQLDLTLEALEGNGSAKILSKPELVVRAPGEAELFAGGELPIRTRTHSSSNISWRPYGLTLKLNVTHLAGDWVRLDILTEVSHLDPSISADAVPGLKANRMKTQVDAHFDTPLFLSGLLQEGARKEARGLPFLRRIPVLGALFGSEDYLNDRSELVAILLPQHKPPHAPSMDVTARATAQIPKKAVTPLPEPQTRLEAQLESSIINPQQHAQTFFPYERFPGRAQ